MRKIEVAKLKLDYNIYPRCQIDNQHIRYMIESLKANVELPPIIVDEKSLRVVDGFHRVSATKRHFKKFSKIMTIFKKYKSEAAMFTDAMKYNAGHGRLLTQFDRAHCIIRSDELKIDPKVIASSLNITVAKVGELRTERIGELTSSVKKKSAKFQKQNIPLKNTIKHKAGKTITKIQYEANEKLSGMNQSFYANQIIILIESNLLDTNDNYLIERLRILHKVLDSVLKSI